MPLDGGEALLGRTSFSLLAAAQLLLTLCLPVTARPREAGSVYVYAVTSGGAAEQAGLKPGDRLVSWASAQGASKSATPVTSVFQWFEVDVQQSLIAPVRLVAKRDGNRLELLLPLGEWGESARPGMPERAWRHFQGGRALVHAKDPRGFDSWRKAESICSEDGDWEASAWIAWQTGLALAKAEREADAEKAFERMLASAAFLGDPAIQCRVSRASSDFRIAMKDPVRAEESAREALVFARKAGQPLMAAACLSELGKLAYGKGDLETTERFFREAAEIRTREVPGTLLEATSLNNLGVVLTARGKLAEARSLYEKAVAIKERFRPCSLDLASSLNNLGMVLQKSGDLENAEVTYLRSLKIKEKLAPDSFDLAVTLNNLGALRQSLGDLPGAEQALRKALAIHESMDPGSSQTAGTLLNLGLVAENRGDLSSADESWHRSLSILEKSMPDSLDLARVLNNLAFLASSREDYVEAERLLRRALEMKRRQAPDSLDVASTLLKLGEVLESRGDYDSASAHDQEALDIRERKAPGSLDVAMAEIDLADLAGHRGQDGEQEQGYRAALAIALEKAPGGLVEAQAHMSLGEFLRKYGKYDEARAHLERAVEIYRRIVPGSARLASSCHALAGLWRDRGGRSAALACEAEATEALESQRGRLAGGASASESFSAKYGEIYRSLVDLLLEHGRPAEAFAVLERYRARAFLDMLAERDLDLRRDAPEEILREKRILDHAYDKAQERLSSLDSRTQAADVEAAQKDLAELRSRQVELAARFRRENPRLAGLQYPEPLGLEAAKESLPRDCLLLSYCVGEKRTLLFALLNGELAAFALPAGQASLSKAVRSFRLLVADPGSGTMADQKGRQLFALLVQPASMALARSKSILVCPDGPLHALPFAALREKRGYFGELRAFARTPSVTLYAEGKRRPFPEDWPVPVVAFGDPGLPDQNQGKGGHGLLPARAGGLAPLPLSRQEAQGVCALGGSGAICLLGAEASEGRALDLGPSVRCAHFACHALVDEEFPLESGLVLSAGPSEQENGLLQAWEILEKVRLDADLVTLSACETALGKEMGGEGLIGLTRAFSYAGARSVLATLWSVSDAGTAEFMGRFYRRYFNGISKAEALRMTRADMVRQGPNGPGAYAHPAYWAGFELVGGSP